MELNANWTKGYTTNDLETEELDTEIVQENKDLRSTSLQKILKEGVSVESLLENNESDASSSRKSTFVIDRHHTLN